MVALALAVAVAVALALALALALCLRPNLIPGSSPGPNPTELINSGWLAPTGPEAMPQSWRVFTPSSGHVACLVTPCSDPSLDVLNVSAHTTSM